MEICLIYLPGDTIVSRGATINCFGISLIDLKRKCVSAGDLIFELTLRNLSFLGSILGRVILQTYSMSYTRTKRLVTAVSL